MSDDRWEYGYLSYAPPGNTKGSRYEKIARGIQPGDTTSREMRRGMERTLRRREVAERQAEGRKLSKQSKPSKCKR